MTTRRNDPCACGSGKKTKKCCGGADAHQTRNRLIALAPIAVLAGLGIYAALAGGEKPAPSPAVAANAAAPAPAIPTAATTTAAPSMPAAEQQKALPPSPGTEAGGRIWSAEHGHWHRDPNASAVEIEQSGGAPTTAAPAQIPTPSADGTPQPQPEGPVPAGKVWSSEHGHWHDAGPTRPPEPVHLGTINQGRLFPRPEGKAPEGGVWSTEHGHWHRADGSEQ